MLSVTNKPLMLNVVMLNVVMLNVVMLIVVMLNVIMALDSNPLPLDDEESQRILPEGEGSVWLTSFY
jgi:hypothetical protein